MVSDKKIVKWLIAQRNLVGITQKQLSDILKTTQSFISKYETFQKKLNLCEFLTICKVLKCDPTEVIRGELKNENQ